MTKKFFLDTEFISNPNKQLTLISIGLCQLEPKSAYYAISSEFNECDASDWVKENVIPKLSPIRKPINIIKEENKDQFRRCSEAGYEVLCIPCVGEGSRVEKVNFAGSGCLVIYSNVDVDYESEWTSSSKYIEVIQQYNKDQIAKCKEYGVDVMVIPCTGEGSRKEYIIFEDMEKEENND